MKRIKPSTMNNKYFAYTIGFIAGLILCFWVFNHVSPWLSIVLFLIWIYFLITVTLNHLNKTK